MKPIEPRDKKLYEMIVAYIKAGGKDAPFIENFCKKYDIDKQAFIHNMSKNADEWTIKLRKVGLID